MKSSNRILVVDDEASMRELLEIVLDNDGYNVTTVGSVENACDTLEEETFDVVLTDLRMGNDHEAGMTVLNWIQDHTSHTPSIMMTAHGSVETAISAMKRGATDYIMKPFKNEEIRLLVKRAIEQRNLVRENTALREDQAQRGQLENMVGNSPAVERVREMIQRVARLPSTIAIHGESGTGKELVARGIHEMSLRNEKPFVAINCGGIPENLLESELFGHKKGSFTGAHQDKEGLFVSADGGTLFLDEIGEMPLSLQVKLLRVLDDSCVTPVGGTIPQSVDVRLLSATNRNLEKMASEGSFREDLYYRLNVIPIVVPPIRERADDIPLLTQHFVKHHADRMELPIPQIDDDVLELLCAYSWPGNVRELENAMERSVALCDGRTISLADLSPTIRNFSGTPPETVTELAGDGVHLEDLITEIEMNLIRQALLKAKHSQKRAAELLGLTPRSLRYRLQKYEMEDA